MITPQPMPVHHRFQSLLGRVFGNWTVEAYAGKDMRARKQYWTCRCICGNTGQIETDSLKRGNSKGCTQCRTLQAGDHTRTHGLTRTREHRAWCDARNRCRNPNNRGYKNYGGRGIEFCEVWDDFATFLADMGPCPPKMSLERKDVNGNYCRENCCWATQTTQARNRRHLKRYTYAGRTLLLVEWAELLGIPLPILQGRARQRWTVERMLTQPLRRTCYRSAEERRQAMRAKDAINNAIKAGDLEKPAHCQHPGCLEPKVQGHHHRGYTDPFDVIWLCRPHHNEHELKLSGIPLRDLAAPESYA